ncbi:McrB family protein [Azoarcus olearius]|uniref:McrB family protein n=1 Tax=Azoarcus sp. (strain BH72) TaxID=418699 RepID=UPI000B146DA1|nr:restriction endonuclease [Azoarcus olearius]
MTGRLESDAALKAQLDAVLAGTAISVGAQGWYAKLSAFLDEVKASIPSKLQDADFLKRLWDDNPVAATGMGSVKVAPALADVAFRSWFAAEVSKPLATDAVEAQAQLTALYNGLRDQLKPLCGRTPRLKINRVLCAIYPEHFTTLADPGKLLFLHQEMGGGANDHPVRAHNAIRARVDAVLGPVTGGTPIDAVRRICLPWMLYERVVDDGTNEASAAPTGDVTTLKPLPATLRRKGLTSIKGGFQTLLGYLPELSEGVSKEEFADIIKQSNPELAPSSLITSINVVSREFDLCKRDGDTYGLSARGINLLETQDPDELADHLLTKILGVDNVVKALESGPQTKLGLVAMLRKINPGWTSDFAPSSLLWWLSSLGVIVADKKQMELTERGRRWAELVTWVPQSLPKAVEAVEDVEDVKAEVAEEVLVPAFAPLWERLNELAQGKLAFDQSLVSQLHAGLWFHPVRHFAVLTGISGSGKTQLALNYALALCNAAEGDHDRVRVIPVQPGWYDPSPLLGYVNPIQESSYRSAPFLDLLLRAAADPEQPYVAILDEMNLSHPEQYLAPILSAMETRGWLDLHQLGDDGTPIPKRLRYPSNLAIIGTLNMDETTHGLSDKVLDRAYTLEFWNISVQDFPGWKTVQLTQALKEKTQAVLTQLVDALAPVRLHFGWRTIDDVLSFLTFHASFAPTEKTALDNVIYAKVLPKLRGEASVKFQKALQDTYKVLADNGLLRCCEKVKSLQEDLAAMGSARFWR